MKLFFSLTFVLVPFFAVAKEVDFNRDVRPILSQNCYVCHGPDKEHRKAKLRLDTEEGFQKVFSKTNPSDSEIIHRITSHDPDEIMPTPESGKSLNDEEVKILTQWVKEGGEYSQPWAYTKPVWNTVKNKSDPWVHNWIDSILLDHWSKVGMSPSPDSNKVTLIRRLSFDLTGLPPKPEMIKKYLSSTNSEAVYLDIVQELLDSDHYGERMSMYWLDLVRFADTVGYHGDQDHNISPYRDYIMEAFNQNMPFDQFTREQLAGDLLDSPSIDQKVATGYNRLLQTSHEGGVQPREYLAIYAADRIRNVSGVWMGATVGCAQCHDHKYDPYTARDFYSMSAFFADIDEEQHFKVGSNALPTKRPPEIPVLSFRDREELKRLESIKSKTQEIIDKIKSIKARERLTMVTQSVKPRLTRILPRGNWLDETGEIVEPAVPAFLGDLKVEDRRANRLDFANWLVDPENGVGGLTARVFVNRLWYLMFGEGISTSLDDFGGQGSPPTIPALLDNLSVEFHKNGWDIKGLIKLIVTSHAYKLSSNSDSKTKSVDPLNHHFSHQSMHRLPAEMIRDNILETSGLLFKEYGGPSVKPFQPKGYYKHLNFPKREYQAHTDKRRLKRSVYIHWQRQFLHPMLQAMDAPTREECVAKRSKSNSPVAAMVLLNDPSFYEAAEEFAKIIIQSANSDDERIKFAFQRALFRDPDELEENIINQLLKNIRQGLSNDGQLDLLCWTAVTRAIFNFSEFNTRN
ncbi:MAG: PSD1 and planctomycete cytochrome C domain-containing protein [Verrucomicrobiales bacterium]